MRPASEAFEAWMAAAIVPVARRFGFTGNGPTFRKRSAGNWILFNLERRHIDPGEARLVGEDPAVEFRVNVGVASLAARPTWAPPRGTRPPTIPDLTILGGHPRLHPDAGAFRPLFRADHAEAASALAERIGEGLDGALRGLEGGVSTRPSSSVACRFRSTREPLARWR